MLSLRKIILAAGLFFALGLPVAQANTNIGVLDLQFLLSEAKAAKDIQEQVNAEREKFVEQLAKEEEGLRAKEKEIMAQAKDLSQEEMGKKRGEFERAFQEARTKAQTGKARIERGLVKAMEKLRAEISVVVEQILEQEGYDIVLPRQNLIAGGDDIDISKMTLDRLDDKITKIKLELDE